MVTTTKRLSKKKIGISKFQNDAISLCWEKGDKTRKLPCQAPVAEVTDPICFQCWPSPCKKLHAKISSSARLHIKGKGHGNFWLNMDFKWDAFGPIKNENETYPEKVLRNVQSRNSKFQGLYDCKLARIAGTREDECFSNSLIH